MAPYGRVVTATAVEESVKRRLRDYLGAYLGETLVQSGLDRMALQDPVDIERASEFDWAPESKLPLVLIVSPGLADDAEHDTDTMHLVWDVRVSTLVSRSNRRDTRTAAQIYAAAVGQCLQHKGIDLEGAHVRFTGESSQLVAERDARSLMAGEAQFRVRVYGARSLYGGPAEPPAPGERPEEQSYPIAETYETDLEKVPLADPLLED